MVTCSLCVYVDCVFLVNFYVKCQYVILMFVPLSQNAYNYAFNF